MSRKDFHEMVDFSLALNEWAATQPGHKSPVTDADVQEVMAKIRPQLKKLEQKSSDLTKLKYSVLVEIIKMKSPRAKLPISMKVVVVRNQQQIEELLLKEKLLDLSKNVTDLGRRYVEDFERNQAKEK